MRTLDKLRLVGTDRGCHAFCRPEGLVDRVSNVARREAYPLSGVLCRQRRLSQELFSNEGVAHHTHGHKPRWLLQGIFHTSERKNNARIVGAPIYRRA